MKEYLVLEKSIGGFFKTVFANDMLEYSTERSLSNCIQMGIMEVLENDYKITKHHTTSTLKDTAYIESFKVEGDRREINKLGQVRLFNDKKIFIVAGDTVYEFQLLKVVGKINVYLKVNSRLNYPNVFFYRKDGVKEVAVWQRDKTNNIKGDTE